MKDFKAEINVSNELKPDEKLTEYNERNKTRKETD